MKIWYTVNSDNLLGRRAEAGLSRRTKKGSDMNRNIKPKTLKLVQMAILIAIMLIFSFTNIGYIKIGVIEFTLMVLPVAVGAMVCGPVCGAILGGVFGITSFIQCFGMSTFGTFLFSLNPWLTLVTCLVPRVLCGWLSGLIFKAINKIDKTKMVSYFVGGLSTALLNTLFFMGCIVLFFWKNASFVAAMNESKIATDTVWAFLVGFVGINGVVEAAVNFVVAAAASKAIVKMNEKTII